MPGVYQAGVFLWKCQDTTVSQVALFGAGYHAFLEWYGVNNTCAPFLLLQVARGAVCWGCALRAQLPEDVLMNCHLALAQHA